MLAVDYVVEQFYILQNHHTMEVALQCEPNCLNERLKMSDSKMSDFERFLPLGSRDELPPCPDLGPGSTLDTSIHGRSLQ